MNKQSFTLGYGLGFGVAALLVGAIGYRVMLAQPSAELISLDLVDLKGHPISPAQLIGRPLVINYWATWCEPCLREFPLLERAKQAADPDVQFIMVSDEPAAKIQAFARQHAYSFTFWRLAKPLAQVSVRPATYAFNRRGQLVDKRLGSFGRLAQIQQMMTSLAD